MGLVVVRRVAELGDALVLAPERFDPRRGVGGGGRCLAELAEILVGEVIVRSFPAGRPVLVLDTTHAFEGFVVLRHGPEPPGPLRSLKRRLAPGDVILSRLRPYLRQVAYVDEGLFRLAPGGNEVCASAEFVVLRGRGGLDAAALVPFLLSGPVQAALAAGQEGGHHPRVAKALLASLRVPAAALRDAEALAAQVRGLAAQLRYALDGSRGLVAATELRMGPEPVAPGVRPPGASSG
jgi:hypothetical protein